jgi:hypothetical protein
LLEQQAQILVSDARIRTLIHQLGEVVRLLKLAVLPPSATFEEAFRELVQTELNAKLATIADGDAAHASALTKLLLSAGYLKQSDGDSSSNS